MAFLRQGFPVEDCLSDLLDALQTQACVILEAPPGAGKTTLVPLHLFHHTGLIRQKILILEPRRLAAKTAAHRMAHLLGEKVGQTVGYRIRGDQKVSKHTRIEVVTEGILTRMIQSEPDLPGIDLVIFDEFHERSLQADLGLAFSLETLEALREDLKILIMSATLSGQNLPKILPDAPVIKSRGRQHPVDIRYLDRPSLFDLTHAVSKAVIKAVDLDHGSVLVFLPGEGEIRRTERLLQDALGHLDDILIVPLFGRLSAKEQDKAINPCPAPFRKIVLATTIAETSLTIEGVRVVIDCGYKRVARFDENKAMNVLETVRISKSSADQRAGRAGRMEPGRVYRLWPEPENRVLSERDTPEILSTDLLPFCLELAQWGLVGTDSLKLLDQPAPKAVSKAQGLLQNLNILDENCQLSAHGKKVCALSLHPRLAHMVIWSERISKSHQKLACLMSAYLEEGSQRPKHGADFSSELVQLIEAKSTHGPLGRVVQNAQSLYHHLHLHEVQHAPIDQAARLLAQAFADRIALQRPHQKLAYHLANGQGARLKDGDKLTQHRFLVIAELGGTSANGTIYQALGLDEDDLKADFHDRLIEKDRVGWDDQTQDLKAERQLCLDQIVLKSTPLAHPDPNSMAQGLCHYIRKKGLEVLAWSEEARDFQNRLVFLSHHDPKRAQDFPDFGTDALKENLEDWLAPYLTSCRRTDHLNRLDLLDILKNQLSWDQVQTLNQLVPSHVRVPSGSLKKVQFEDPDHPYLKVKLQEMFGTQETPSLLSGRVKIRLHLLSPAGRPLQVTDDIGRFWQTSYDSVKKEMKGRYPKHPWPDDPLSAIASAKTRKHLPPLNETKG